jgi:membrane protein YdbS with pleckstrin-like domain
MDDAGRIAALGKLADLYRAGSLTADEYAAEKAKLIAGGDLSDGTATVVSEEQPVEQFHGSTAGWLFGSALGWLVILLCLSPIAAFALTEDTGTRYVSLALLAASFAAILVRWIGNAAKKYELTTQRLIMRTGILFKRVDEIELYRVKDSRVDFSLLNQLTGIGTITLRSSDVSSQETDFRMRDVPRARDVREKLRTLVDRARQRRQVRELDIDGGGI